MAFWICLACLWSFILIGGQSGIFFICYGIFTMALAYELETATMKNTAAWMGGAGFASFIVGLISFFI